MSEHPQHAHGEPDGPAKVQRFATCDQSAARQLLRRYGLQLEHVPAGREIPGSYWGDEEAGLIGNRLLVRDDTPVHSMLHETCHYICMDERRRNGLDTDAGGGYDEENAVCYLQILLAGLLPGCSQERMCGDMDRWGYTFRLGSASAWFHGDAGDARAWLRNYRLIEDDDSPTWRLRKED